MTSFANQVVLITGAGSGIGRHLAGRFAREGAAVAALDREPAGLAELAAELGNQRFASAVADVTQREALKQAVSDLAGRLGPIDILIANAGIGLRTSGRDFRAADIEAQVNVNLIGVANSIEAVLPGMLERRRGHIVAISSLASYRGLPTMGGYCASKAGVNALMDSLRVELHDSGVAFSTICPSFIRTPLTAGLAGRLPMMDLPEACDLMMEAIRRKRSLCTFPRRSAFRARLLRWLPVAWSDWLTVRYLKRHMEPGD